MPARNRLPSGSSVSCHWRNAKDAGVWGPAPTSIEAGEKPDETQEGPRTVAKVPCLIKDASGRLYVSYKTDTTADIFHLAPAGREMARGGRLGAMPAAAGHGPQVTSDGSAPAVGWTPSTVFPTRATPDPCSHEAKKAGISGTHPGFRRTACIISGSSGSCVLS
jgi:hypothetical protein